jgi:RimJ/RimL family protein N-acetyltransferase
LNSLVKVLKKIQNVLVKEEFMAEMQPILKTERLLLRQWCKKNLTPFAALNAGSRVREHFPELLNRQESDASVKLMSSHIQKYNWGFWAASSIQTNEFIGFIGLENVHFSAPFNKLSPAVEIGWRLAFNHWGKGYATEAAKAALRYSFIKLNLVEIVSFTAVQNIHSQKVMKKINMHHDPKDDFDHSKLVDRNPLRRHVLYRLYHDDWEKLHGSYE